MSEPGYRLNVLILHRLGNPSLARSFLLKHVRFLSRYAPEHNYLYHDARLALPEYVKEFPFHGVILDVTFLGSRYIDLVEFELTRDRFGFVADLDAYKIAMPQDEYDCNELLDDWMCALDIDRVYSVIAGQWEVLYPKYHATGRIRLGYTGYIDDDLVAWAGERIRPHDGRRRDVGYRARKLPPYFGRIGEVKWRIAETFLSRAIAAGLDCDISVRDTDAILGDRWLEFLGDCRFVLGTPSGSSLLDPRGEIQRAVRRYLSRRSDASYDEIGAAVFPGLDGPHEFTALSPRNIEAALVKCCQILVPGEYSGLLQPWEHYIPIASDCRDFDDTLSAMRDAELVQRIVESCHARLLENDVLRYATLAHRVVEEIEAGATRKGAGTSYERGRALIARYERDTRAAYARLWASNFAGHFLRGRAPAVDRAIASQIRKVRRLWAG